MHQRHSAGWILAQIGASGFRVSTYNAPGMVKSGNSMTSKYFYLTLLLTLLTTTSAFTQTSFENYKHDVLMDAAQRHLDLGVWCRDRGLTSQATVEFYSAVEVSERQHPGALRVLAFMTSLDDAFWKKNRKRPSESSINSYSRKAAKARLGDRKDRVALAAFAWKKEMRAEAEAEYESILRKRDEPLEVDSKGRFEVEGSTIPIELSKHFLSGAVTINDEQYLRDPFLDLLPNVKIIQQVESESLRVRSVLTPETTAEFHALGEALFPHLQEALLGKPLVRLNLFVFAERATYEQYLAATEQLAYKSVAGLAQSSNLTAVVCAEGLEENALRGVILHELTHLYIFSMTRAIMPSWHSEGFAELFGGQGTFTWDGTKLEVGGMMANFRLAPLRERSSRFTIEEMLSSEAIELFANNRERAFQFYAQSWALLYYLRTDADKDKRNLFEAWEQRCFGSAVGAQVGNLNQSDSRLANELFRRMFGEELPKLEAEFHTWLDGLFLP